MRDVQSDESSNTGGIVSPRSQTSLLDLLKWSLVKGGIPGLVHRLVKCHLLPETSRASFISFHSSSRFFLYIAKSGGSVMMVEADDGQVHSTKCF